MPVDVSTDIVIARPREKVAAYAGDPSNAPAWYVNILDIEWETRPPLREGTRLGFVARFLGRTLRYTYVVVELVPCERLVMRAERGPFPMETIYTWETLDAHSTRMVLRNRGEPRGFARYGSRLMAAAMERANRKDLARLKNLIETGRP